MAEPVVVSIMEFSGNPDEVLGKMNVGSFHLPRNVPTLVPRLLKQASVQDGKIVG